MSGSQYERKTHFSLADIQSLYVIAAMCRNSSGLLIGFLRAREVQRGKLGLTGKDTKTRGAPHSIGHLADGI